MNESVLAEIRSARDAGKGWTVWRPMKEADPSFSCSSPIGRLFTGKCPHRAAFVSYSTTIAAATTQCLQHWLDFTEGSGRCEEFTVKGWRCRLMNPCRTHHATH